MQLHAHVLRHFLRPELHLRYRVDALRRRIDIRRNFVFLGQEAGGSRLLCRCPYSGKGRQQQDGRHQPSPYLSTSRHRIPFGSTFVGTIYRITMAHEALPAPGPSKPAISSAARSTAPGGPSRLLTSSNPSRWLARALGSWRSLSVSPATFSGVKSSCTSSGTTAFSAIRLTIAKYGARTSGFVNVAVNGDTRYTTTMGTFSSAASTVAVPLDTIDASAAASALYVSPSTMRSVNPPGQPPLICSAFLGCAAATTNCAGFFPLIRAHVSCKTGRWCVNSPPRLPGKIVTRVRAASSPCASQNCLRSFVACTAP